MTIAIDQTLVQDIKNLIVRYCTPSNFDDAVQEALIKAWQLSDSDYSRDKILAKAVDRGKAVINPNAGSVPLGKPTRSKTGYRSFEGNSSRQKIKQFQTDFQQLHNRLPAIVEISRGLGMSTRNVADHLVKIRTDRRSVPVSETNRLREPLSYSLDVLNAEDEIVANTIEFEDMLLDCLSFIEMVSTLEQDDRELLYLAHVQGMTNAEVSRCLKKSDSTIRDRMKRIHLSLRNHTLTVQHL